MEQPRFSNLRLSGNVSKMSLSRWFKVVDALRKFSGELRLFPIFERRGGDISLLGVWICSIEVALIVVDIFLLVVHRHIILLLLTNRTISHIYWIIPLLSNSILTSSVIVVNTVNNQPSTINAGQPHLDILGMQLVNLAFLLDRVVVLV